MQRESKKNKKNIPLTRHTKHKGCKRVDNGVVCQVLAIDVVMTKSIYTLHYTKTKQCSVYSYVRPSL